MHLTGWGKVPWRLLSRIGFGSGLFSLAVCTLFDFLSSLTGTQRKPVNWLARSCEALVHLHLRLTKRIQTRLYIKLEWLRSVLCWGENHAFWCWIILKASVTRSIVSAI